MLEVAEMAGWPIPHDDLEEFDIVSFVSSWQTAMVHGISGALGVLF